MIKLDIASKNKTNGIWRRQFDCFGRAARTSDKLE